MFIFFFMMQWQQQLVTAKMVSQTKQTEYTPYFWPKCLFQTRNAWQSYPLGRHIPLWLIYLGAEGYSPIFAICGCMVFRHPYLKQGIQFACLCLEQGIHSLDFQLSPLENGVMFKALYWHYKYSWTGYPIFLITLLNRVRDSQCQRHTPTQ